MTEKSLIKIETLKPAEIFAKGGIQKLIDQTIADVKGHTLDLTTKKGQEDIASLAYKVSRSKTAVQDLAKEQKKPLQEVIDNINGELKLWNTAMDSLRDEIKKPLDDFKAAEGVRKKALKDRITSIENLGGSQTGKAPEAIEAALVELQALFEHEWQEYSGMANDEYDAAKEKMRGALSDANIRKKEQEELAELRKKQAVADAQAEADRKELEELRAEKAANEKASKETDPVPTPDITTSSPAPAPVSAHVPVPAPAREATPALAEVPRETPAALSDPVALTVAASPTIILSPDLSGLISDIYDGVNSVLRDEKLSEEVVDAIEGKLEQWVGKMAA